MQWHRTAVERKDKTASIDDAAGDVTFDVGVIFVHGIGSQATGATLLTWAEPLLELLTKVGKSYGFATRVATADALVSGEPELVFEVTREDRRATWLLTEARWAEAFHPSPAADVLRWAGRFVWRAARRGLAALLNQIWFSFTQRLLPNRDMFTSRKSGIMGWLRTGTLCLVALLLMGPVLFVLIAPFPLLLLALLLFSPLLVVLAVGAIFSLLVLQRIPLLGPRVAPLVADLVTSIGDAQAYRDRAIQEAAMRQVLRSRIADASRRAANVVLVAHSQGAAISCRMLLEEEEPWPARLVTIGAGTNLLNKAESVREWQSLGSPPWTNLWSPRDLVPAGPMGDSPKAVRSRWMETVWHQSQGGFLLVSYDGERVLGWRKGVDPPGCWVGNDDLIAQTVSSRGKRRATFMDPSGGKAVIIRTPDPVTERLHPNEAMEIAEALVGDGHWTKLLPSLRDFQEPGPEEIPVANRWSVIRDHTSYARNLTQVQYMLAHTLLDLAESTAGILPDLLRNSQFSVEKRHVARVRKLAMSRLISAVSAAAVVHFFARRDIWSPLTEAVAWAVRRSEAGAWVIHSQGNGLVQLATLALTSLVAFAVISGLLNSTWNEWHRRERLRLSAEPSSTVTRRGLSGMLFFILYWLSLILSSVYWGKILAPDSYFFSFSFLRFMLVMTYLVWATVWPYVGIRASYAAARPTPS